MLLMLTAGFHVFLKVDDKDYMYAYTCIYVYINIRMQLI